VKRRVYVFIHCRGRGERFWERTMVTPRLVSWPPPGVSLSFVLVLSTSHSLYYTNREEGYSSSGGGRARSCQSCRSRSRSRSPTVCVCVSGCPLSVFTLGRCLFFGSQHQVLLSSFECCSYIAFVCMPSCIVVSYRSFSPCPTTSRYWLLISAGQETIARAYRFLALEIHLKSANNRQELSQSKDLMHNKTGFEEENHSGNADTRLGLDQDITQLW